VACELRVEGQGLDEAAEWLHEMAVELIDIKELPEITPAQAHHNVGAQAIRELLEEQQPTPPGTVHRTAEEARAAEARWDRRDDITF
jgi:hypothetical protein